MGLGMPFLVSLLYRIGRYIHILTPYALVNAFPNALPNPFRYTSFLHIGVSETMVH